jgi:hypothetical protein
MQSIVIFGIFIGIIGFMWLLSIYPEILLYPLFIFATLFLCGMALLGILLVINAALTKNDALILVGIIITLFGIGITVGLFFG